MLISNAVTRAVSDISARERDVMQAFTPGASADAGMSFALDPLSVAAPRDAYFMVTAQDGRTAFTRDGVFSMRDGLLVDASGDPVLGMRSPGGALEALQADAVDVALGFTRDAHIDADGSVAYDRTAIDPRSGRRERQRVVIGRIALARFPAGKALPPIDAQHAAAPAGIVPHSGAPGDGNFALLRPFARAESGVDLDAGLQRLQEAYAALDAIRAAGTARDSLDKTAMDLLK